jgi:hypothetical protein
MTPPSSLKLDDRGQTTEDSKTVIRRLKSAYQTTLPFQRDPRGENP